MLQSTVERVRGMAVVGQPIVVCNNEHRFLVAEQLRAIGVMPAAVILEPAVRNTAPAVTLAALQALEREDEAVLLVLPADHLIADVEAFQHALAEVMPFAREGRLITFGIVPTGPETGYGYIKTGQPVAGKRIWTVERFVEKPDAATARSYLEAGGYYWNSGMFMFQASRFLEELRRYAPEILDTCREAMAGAHTDLDFIRLDQVAFEACPGNSVDYAVMEKTNDAVVMPLDVGWSDVGSWSSLWEVGRRDDAGNVAQGDVLALDCTDSYFHAADRLIAAVGVHDFVVVETADAVLVAPKKRVQEVKGLVNRLEADSRGEGKAHRKIYRPWGSYDSIDCEDRFQVKHITVNPGASLSLQMHYHRAEHWIVVKGTARITRGDEVFVLTENQSTYIPLGTRHRMENPGKIPLELIEVQSGGYLGEDDIVRFDDVYGRKDELAN